MPSLTGTGNTGYAGYFLNTTTGSSGGGLFASTSGFGAGITGVGATGVSGSGETGVTGFGSTGVNALGFGAPSAGSNAYFGVKAQGQANTLGGTTSVYGVFSQGLDTPNGGTAAVYGVYGQGRVNGFNGGNVAYGVYGETSSGNTAYATTYGVYGTDAYGYYGVYGSQTQGSGGGYGGYFTNSSTGTGFGLYAEETGASNTGYALYASNTSSSGWAGYFNGNVNITGDSAISGTTTVNNITITGSCIGCLAAGSNALSAITSALTTNTIDNTNEAQVWNWNSLTTQNAFTLGTSHAFTGSLLNLSATAVSATSTGSVLSIADATTGSGYGIYAAMTTSNNSGTALYVTNTGTVNTGYALYANDTSNSGYAVYANGNSYLNGTTTIAGDLIVTGNSNLAGTTTVNNITITGTCVGCVSAGSQAISSLTSALTSNTIDNAAYTQTWTWNGLTTGNALVLSTSAVNTGNLLTLNETAADATSTGKALSISNATTGSGYGVYSVLTGHGNTGYAGYFENTDTSNSLNYAIKANSSSANSQSAAIGAFSSTSTSSGFSTAIQAFANGVAAGASTAGVNSRANEANGGSAWGVIGTANGNASGTLYGGSFTANPSFLSSGTAYGVTGDTGVVNTGTTVTALWCPTATTSFSMSRAERRQGYGVYGTNTSGSAGKRYLRRLWHRDAYGYYGVYGSQTQGSGGGYGGYFTNSSTGTGFGLYAGGNGRQQYRLRSLCKQYFQQRGYAGYFNGNVNITGDIRNQRHHDGEQHNDHRKLHWLSGSGIECFVGDYLGAYDQHDRQYQPEAQVWNWNSLTDAECVYAWNIPCLHRVAFEFVSDGCLGHLDRLCAEHRGYDDRIGLWHLQLDDRDRQYRLCDLCDQYRREQSGLRNLRP